MRTLISFLLLLGPLTAASPAVRWIDSMKLGVLETDRSSYVLGVNDLGYLQHVYWGGKLTRPEDFAPARAAAAFAFESREGMTSEEYPAWGGMRYGEPCLRVTLADGVRDAVLKYQSHEVRGDQLRVTLRDIQTGLFADLIYRVYARHGLIARHAVIRNQTKQSVVIESAQSAVWHLPNGGDYRLSHLAGRWAGETQLVQENIAPGKKVIESRRGNTSHQANPWFAIDADGEASQERGRVWFGALAWSGNWKFVVEQTPNQQTRLTGGYNDFDFAYPLKPGEQLETPVFYAGYTEEGFGDASRRMHRFQREEILPDRAAPKVRPVLYNSWEATTFQVDEAGQKALADKAAKIGVELFVMDDGWFGARDHDRAGLGDWFVNPKKFPNGLKALIDHVNGLGMKFGLWVEPEMVNPDSDLYRQHPDWAIHFPGRPRTEGRNQLILNMARDDVKEFIFALLDKLLAENNIAFIKWDMNRHFTEPGWPQLPAPEQRKIWVKYVTNVYEIFDRLRAKHPKLEIEACSGGGGRVDLGILRRVDQVWTSDNTEAFDRLTIQDGFSYAYTPKVMMDWITDVPNMNGRSTPLKYRFLVSMMGSVGIGANLNHWSPSDFDLASRMVAYYKRIRATVQQGSLYRLSSPRTENLTANQYVSSDGRQAVLFAFLHAQQFRYNAPPVYLRGLDENALYKLTPLDEKQLAERARTVSGAYLMHRGLNFRLGGDFDSASVLIERVP
ncbi:MAG: alpha-galactosidase [Acidobacteria bacterium]|nr:alpha-galactosidase [Acidobacteriota bacterium]